MKAVPKHVLRGSHKRGTSEACLLVWLLPCLVVKDLHAFAMV